MAVRLEVLKEAKAEPQAVLNGLPGLRLFTAEEYQRLAEIGILDEDERVELIEGRIVQMPAKNTRHTTATTRANRYFNRLFGERVIIRVQDPILLNDFSEPEPDIVLAAPPDERYLEHHPTPKDIFLVLEIADSSLAYDRDVKCPLFARNGIVQFCLLNVRDRELEDYRNPGPDGYRSKQTYLESQSFNLVAFPKVSVRVKDLLPPVKAARKRRQQ
jgi:Uma2 family endonuclease